MAIWRKLLIQEVALPFSFARLSAGRSIAARIAMIAITTNNSISVNPLRSLRAWHIIPFSWGLLQLSHSQATLKREIMRQSRLVYGWNFDSNSTPDNSHLWRDW